MYERGLAGNRVDEELELYEADELFMFWSSTPRQPWQTEAYYAEQARILRPNTFTRLHLNQWTVAESVFITLELWTPCVDPGLTRRLVSPDLAVYVGVDGSTKGDSSAVVTVTLEGEQLVLVDHRIWQPSAKEPLDLEATIEAYLRELNRRFHVRRIVCDPYQLHRSITTLKAEGLRIEEFPQTVGNTTRMGQTLYELLKGRNLRMYESDELRQQALNTVAIESDRGFRIAKVKASKKIDAIVALSMACCAAIEQGGKAPMNFWFCGDTDDESVTERLARQEKQDAEDRAASAAALEEECKREGCWSANWSRMNY